MAKLIKSTLYRVLHSKTSLIVFIIGIIFCIFSSFPADLYTIGRVEKKLASDEHALERLQNVFEMPNANTPQEMMEVFTPRNFPYTFECTNTALIFLPVFLAAVLLGRSFYKQRLQPELLHSKKWKIAASRLLILHILCAIVGVCIQIWALMRWTDWRAYPTGLLVRNTAFTVIIALSNSAFVAMIFFIFGGAIKSSAISVAALIAFMRLSLVLPVTPVRNAITAATWEANVPTAELIPLIIWAIAYFVIFTAVSIVVFYRREFK